MFILIDFCLLKSKEKSKAGKLQYKKFKLSENFDLILLNSTFECSFGIILDVVALISILKTKYAISLVFISIPLGYYSQGRLEYVAF